MFLYICSSKSSRFALRFHVPMVTLFADRRRAMEKLAEKKRARELEAASAANRLGL